MNTRINVFGIDIDNVSWSEAIAFIQKAILSSNSAPKFIVTPNVDHIIQIQRDPEFKNIYSKADLVLCDSQIVMWTCKLLGQPLEAKIPGSILLPVICREAPKYGWKLFFLGAGPGVAKAAARKLEQQFPGLQVTGFYSPPYGFIEDHLENRKIIRILKKAEPDILFVGLGAPKQERWIYEHKDEYHVPISIGVGAAFDFISGNVQKAPRWMTNYGLEWFWRFLQEPRRLWKRYFIRDLAFIPLLAKEFIKRFVEERNE